MLTCKVPFQCVLCGEEKDFYVMPLDKKVSSKEKVHSLTYYKIVCKKCGKEHFFHYRITT